MVKLEAVRASNKALVKKQFITAVFVGGTSGIGENAVRALSSTHATSGKGLRVYIVGRNDTAAKSIIAECRKACPSGEFHFVRASDLSSIREVDRVCREISDAEEATTTTGKLACIDLLVMSQALFAFGGRLQQQGTDIRTHITSLRSLLLTFTEQRPARDWKGLYLCSTTPACASSPSCSLYFSSLHFLGA